MPIAWNRSSLRREAGAAAQLQAAPGLVRKPDGSMVLWMVAKSISHHLKTMVETRTFVGIYRGIIILGFL